MDSKLLLDNIILKVEIGSTAHGTGDPGKEDYDEMAVAVEPWQAVLGMDSIETLVYRPGRGPEDPSGPGDLDLVVYPLKKLIHLLASANPSVMMLLWSNVVQETVWGRSLRSMQSVFISKRIFKTHLGYAQSQIKRLEDGKFYKSRAKIVEAYGYDTKYAMHALRLILQGIELATNKTIELPIPDPDGQILRDLRRGKYSKGEFFEMFNDKQEELQLLEEKSDLPDDADYKLINAWLRLLYEEKYLGSQDNFRIIQTGIIHPMLETIV